MHQRFTSTSRSRHRIHAVSAIAATALCIASIGVFSTASAEASTPRISFSSAVPSWAKKASVAGSTSPSAVVEAEIFLALQDAPVSAPQLAANVSNPSSPDYRHYLTADEWQSTYSPSQADFQSEADMLTSHNMTITGSPASREYIVFRGTVAAMSALFGTPFATYSVDGQRLVAPSATPSLPRVDADAIAGVSLDQGRLLTRPDGASQSPKASSATAGFLSLTSPKVVTIKTACSAYTNQHQVKIPAAYGRTLSETANCGYTPAQLRSVYKTTSTSGSGQTVAIVGAYNSPSIVRDVDTYSKFHSEPQLVNGQYSDQSVAPTSFTDEAACGNPSGWQGEQTLDVESVHALAPKANIIYSGASNCGAGTDLALSRILDGGLANIVSNSYGGTGEPTGSGSESYINGEVNLQLQAAGEGIGLYFASGDDGDEKANIGYVSSDFPASSPWVTAVGGTSLGISKTNSRVYEGGWGDQLDQIVEHSKTVNRYVATLPGKLFAGGAGGGKSHVFLRSELPAEFDYQAGVVSTGSGYRVGSDVSALADPYTGFAIGYSPIGNNTTLVTRAYATTTAGGTSLATPLVAAMMATIQQKTGAQIGFANPILYRLKTTSPSSFEDIWDAGRPATQVYSTSSATYLVTHGIDSSYRATKDFDYVTGLGVLNLSYVSGFATPNPS